MFLPGVIIDGRNSRTEYILSTLKSIIKQTMVPPKIKILYNIDSYIDFDTFKSVIESHDGAKIHLSYEVDPYIQTTKEQLADHVDITLLRAIKSFKSVIGILKKDKYIKKKFQISHVIIVIAGHIFKSKNVIERLYESWTNGKYYDAMLFKLRSGQSKKKSYIIYKRTVNMICKTHIWKPLNKRHKIFVKDKPKKDVDFIPIRTCSFGIIDTV